MSNHLIGKLGPRIEGAASKRYLINMTINFSQETFANRKHFQGQLFNRLLNACVSVCTVTYYELVAGRY